MNQREAVLESSMNRTSALADELCASVSLETVIRRDEPLAKRTTLRVGGPADLYVEPASRRRSGGGVAVLRRA